ncbi:hypothetical protein ACN28C_31545 [Plantactinospora sp. WMMC1484]|uniref:hypothetical protein n=1 Tax=Plantactinospora sp. WMMC1484 TaxID=3404122 RepID=UPI003BF5CBD8
MRFADGRVRQFAPLGRVAGDLPARLTGLTGPWRAASGWICTGIGASAAVADAVADRLRHNGVGAVSLPPGDVPGLAATVGWPVLLVSQSGRSTELLATVEALPTGRGLALTNAADSPLAAETGEAVVLGGLADSRASTVGFAALLLAGHMFADWCAGGAPGRGWAAEVAALSAAAVAFGDRLAGTVMDAAGTATDVTDAAGTVSDAAGTVSDAAGWAAMDVVADPDWLAAAEYGALMIREVGRIRAGALETRRYLHGPMESAPGGLTVLVGGDRLDRVADQLAAGPEPAPVLRWSVTISGGRTTVHVPASGLPPLLLDSAALGPFAGQLLVGYGLQEIAQRVAVARGVDPDEFVYDQDDTKLGTPSAPAAPPAPLSTIDERKSN